MDLRSILRFSLHFSLRFNLCSNPIDSELSLGVRRKASDVLSASLIIQGIFFTIWNSEFILEILSLSSSPFVIISQTISIGFEIILRSLSRFD